MRTRTLTALTVSILSVGLIAGGATAYAASGDDNGLFIPGVPAPDSDTFIDGVPAPSPDDASASENGTFIRSEPAPLILTPGQLASKSIALVPGQALLIVRDVDNGGAWTGAGGTGDDAVVRFEAATTAAGDDEAEFTAAFFAEKTGATTAWVAGPDGQRTTFDLTVAAS